MSRTAVAVLLAGLLSLPVSALAADPAGASWALDLTDATAIATSGWAPAPPASAPPTRPALLPILYVSFAALEVFDGYSTTTGLAGGATEVNPLMRGAAGNPGVFWALKTGATLSCVYLSERLWRQHRRGQAIAVMLISNGIAAAVASRNASVLRRR